MVRLEKSEALRRIIRQDDVTELGISTWTLAREAVESGKIDEALRLIDYGCKENKAMHDNMCSSVDTALSRLASFGEEEIYELARKTCYPGVNHWLSRSPGAEESLQLTAEIQRGHGANLTVAEESDRYVMRCDPCGSGGRLRRTKSVGMVSKAYPWTWSKTGVPLYCVHCCVMFEILPTEIRGYPIRVNEFSDKAQDPCVFYFYKKPELIPEEFFTRVGLIKKIR